MSNHVHFIIIPFDEKSLAKVFSVVHMRYSQYINKMKAEAGHLWQGRFYSCMLDEVHLYRAIRYVEQNPVRAKIERKSWDYRWSSAMEHSGEGRSDIILDKTTNIHVEGGINWKEYLEEEDKEITEEMRTKTNKGLAVGTENFIKKLEKELNVSLASKNPGRPCKQ